MIEKERLEELIKQGASIYYIDTTWINKNIKYVCSLALDKRKHTIGYVTYDFSLPEQENRVLRETTEEYGEGIAILKDIYEDLDEAKFNAEFKRIARIEYLDLPTWEEAENMNNYIICEFDWYRLLMCPADNIGDTGWIGIDSGGNCELYHWDNANKENYLKACQKCKELFLGVEDEC